MSLSGRYSLDRQRVDGLAAGKQGYNLYVIELKIDASANEALQQIEDVGYARPFAADPCKFFKIGINFFTKTRRIEEWKIA